MINLPEECRVDKFIPKKIFYEKVKLSSVAKQEFVDKVEKITWKYKISENNINVSKTDEIEEIEIFEVELRDRYNCKNVIRTITKNIPYPILFYIKYENNFQYAVKYKDEIYFSEWNDEVTFVFNGLNIEIIYNDIVKKIINIDNSVKDLESEIRKQTKITSLEDKIRKLESKIRTEKQFNIKVQYNEQITKLKKELEELKNGKI